MSGSTKKPKPFRSQPPDLTDLDVGWESQSRDDSSEDSSVFDRVTAVPSVSPESLASHMMELEDPLDSARSTSIPELPAQDRSLADTGVSSTQNGYDFDDEDLPPALALGPSQRTGRGTFPRTLQAYPSVPQRQHESPSPEPRGAANRHSILELDMDFEMPDSAPPLGAPGSELGLSIDGEPPDTALALADRVSIATDPEPRPEVHRAEGDEPEHRSSWPTSPLEDMKERYAMGDFTGALVVAESILEHEPSHTGAQRYANNCRQVLIEMYVARFGSLAKAVKIAIPHEEVRWLSLDHRAGFLLAMVDGTLTVEELLDVCGMEKLDALRILMTLLDQHVIALG